MNFVRKTILIGALTFSAVSISSCNNNNNNDNSFIAMMDSNTLALKEVSKSDNTHNYTIYNKSSTQGRLPETLTSVKLGDTTLSSSQYSYDHLDGSFTVTAATGKLVVKAELIPTYSINVDSDTMKSNVNYIDVGNDVDIYVKPIDEQTHLYPTSLSYVKTGGKTLSSSEYTYNNQTGKLHIDKKNIKGNISIKGVAIDKGNYAYKVTFICDPRCSVSIYKTSDYTQEPTKGTVTYSVDSNGNFIKDGSGQINFRINVEDGYDVDMILVQGLYKNCKGKEDNLPDDVYRITKIKSDLVVKITAYRIYLKDFTCIGDTTNHTYTFTWNIRNRSNIDYVLVKASSSIGSIENKVYEDKFILSDVEYGIPYTITFTPYSLSGTKFTTKRVKKLMLDPDTVINMPKLNIDTSNGTWPTVNQSGQLTAGMHEGKSAYIKSNVELLDSDGNELYSSKKNANNSKIKTRGNTSASQSLYKKPYKIKFDDPVDLLENYRVRKTEGVNYTHQEWNLIPYTDDMADLFGFATNRALGYEYAHEFVYLVVTINNDYQGLYVLCETNDVGLGEGEEQGRYKVSSTGFLIEHDYFYANEEISFPTLFAGSEYQYTFKYPDIYENGYQRVNTIQKYIIQIEQLLSVRDTTVFNYIDIESFAKWIVSFDVIGQTDNLGANKFLYRYSDSSILKMGTPWDFSRLFSSSIITRGVKSNKEFFFSYLFKYRAFNDEVRLVFDTYKNNIVSIIESEMQKINEIGFNAAIELEKTKYDNGFSSYSTSLNKVKNYISQRILILDRYY